MSPSPVITLTEALTRLAFNQSLAKNDLQAAIYGGKLGPLAETELAQAAQQFCDAGYVGHVSAYGIRSEEKTTSGRRAPILREDFLNYRTYVRSIDGLLSDEAKSGDNSEYSLAFDVFNEADHISEVVVDRGQLEALRTTLRTPQPSKFTDVERRDWILTADTTNGDKAWNMFRGHPRWDGTNQHEFRGEWRELRPARRGAPKKTKS